MKKQKGGYALRRIIDGIILIFLCLMGWLAIEIVMTVAGAQSEQSKARVCRNEFGHRVECSTNEVM